MTDKDHPCDLFISYSRKNKDHVLPIKDEIERELGLTCWVDLSNITCGTENFKKKVIPGIRQTRVAFLFFLSAQSQDSEYAMKEIGFAKKRAQKRVILIRFNDDEMTDDFYFDYQNFDIIDWRAPEQKKKLFRDLLDWAGSEGLPKNRKEAGPKTDKGGAKERTGANGGNVNPGGNAPQTRKSAKSAQAAKIEKAIKIAVAGNSNSNIYVGRGIPAKKLENAVASMKVPKGEKVHALIDTTWFGSAKTGLLFTSFGIRWKNDWATASKKTSLSWAQVSETRHKMTCHAYDLSFSADAAVGLAGGGVEPKELKKLLVHIVELIELRV